LADGLMLVLQHPFKQRNPKFPMRSAGQAIAVFASQQASIGGMPEIDE
jgi:hypothetical protein